MVGTIIGLMSALEPRFARLNTYGLAVLSQAQVTQSPVGRQHTFLRTLDVYGPPVRTATHVSVPSVRLRGSPSHATLQKSDCFP